MPHALPEAPADSLTPDARDDASPGEEPAARRVVLVGATITGNRGAESMLRAVVQRIPDYCPGARFTLLSLYPRDDAAENRDPSLRVVPFSPPHMVLLALPLCLAAGLLRRMRLPFRFLLATKALRAMHDAELVVDLSGISFVDGRGGGILLYNVLIVLLPALLGTPLLKYAQAIGPFRRPLNRRLAQWMLPKVARIAARGRITREHLGELRLDAARIVSCADSAFAMRIGPQAQEEIRPILEHAAFRRPVIAVSASSVVDALCRGHGVDYATPLSRFIQHLIDDREYGVCLLAHSARPYSRKPKNNDLPVCRRIAQLVGREACIFPDTSLSAEAQRALIGRCRLLIASRFHAMVSGLAMGVPTMLVGWSHKYVEVLEDFGLEGYAIDYAQLSEPALRDLFQRLEHDADAVRERIRQRLPAVVESSLGNARLAAELLAAPARTVAAGREAPTPGV